MAGVLGAQKCAFSPAHTLYHRARCEQAISEFLFAVDCAYHTDHFECRAFPLAAAAVVAG